LGSTTAAAPPVFPSGPTFSIERAGRIMRARVAIMNFFMVVLYTIQAFGVGGRSVSFATGQRNKITERVV